MTGSIGVLSLERLFGLINGASTPKDKAYFWIILQSVVTHTCPKLDSFASFIVQ